MVVFSTPPDIRAETRRDIPRARGAADRLDLAAWRERRGAETEQAGALGWLTGSADGRRFLALPPPRALAWGVPRADCPATGMRGGTATRAKAVEGALRACFAGLDTMAQTCGCRLVALDDAMLVGREQMAYATGVTARLRAPEMGIDGLFVAEHTANGATVIHGANAPVAHVTPANGAEVTVRLADGRLLTGRRTLLGVRRGRLAQRIHARDPAGRRFVLLIGFAPEELADSAGAWLAWPG